jgi:thymidylate synthase
LVDGDKLHLLWNQRSVDSFLGLPFNIASYGTLLVMLAAVTDYDPGELIFSGGDCHIYENHLEQVREQIGRRGAPVPTLSIPDKDSLFDYEVSDFEIKDYHPDPPLKGKVAV